jgi:hypothetical protein
MDKGSSVGGSSGGGNDSGINGLVIGGIVIVVLLAALIILSVLKRDKSSQVSSHYYTDESGHNISFTPLVGSFKGTLLQENHF